MFFPALAWFRKAYFVDDFQQKMGIEMTNHDQLMIKKGIALPCSVESL